MAIYQITAANSVLTTAAGQPAFESDTPAADTLIVDAGAFLKAEGQDAFGAYLNRTMAWTVQVNGLIHSSASVGIYLDINNAPGSSVSVGVGGSIHSGQIACYNPTNLINAGRIYGADVGIYSEGASALTVRNSGNIYGGTHSILGSRYADAITNSGHIEGQLILDDGNDQLINAKVIFDRIDMGVGDDTLTNARGAVIYSDVNMGAGQDRLINQGSIVGTVYGGEGNDTITNSGTIGKDVLLGVGLNTLTNTGLIRGSVFGSVDKDVVKNTGTIEGVVDLAGGDDMYTGGNYTDLVVDGAGSDSVRLGGGDDVYFGIGNFNQAEDGVDSIDGGAGFDTYNATSAIDSVFINLDNKAHDFSPFLPGVGIVAANTATGIGLSIDTIRNFEAVIGGAGNDIIYGNAAANLLIGGDGFDTLYGFGGNDVLIGGNGGDALCGGLGRDILTGGAGADFFQFTSVKDSGLTSTTRDAIMDFESGIDKIDLRAIDANTRNGKADDAFVFVGASGFTNTPGELRITVLADMQIVEGDVNGDGKADFSIEILTTPATLQLTAADFLL